MIDGLVASELDDPVKQTNEGALSPGDCCRTSISSPIPGPSMATEARPRCASPKTRSARHSGLGLQRARAASRLNGQVYIVNLYPNKKPLPQHLMEVMARRDEIFCSEKIKRDIHLLHCWIVTGSSSRRS